MKTLILSILACLGCQPQPDDISLNTVLLNAIEKQNLQDIQNLLENGTKLNLSEIQNPSILTLEPPLITAIKTGNKQIIELLIKSGAKLSDKSISNYDDNCIFVAFEDLEQACVNSDDKEIINLVLIEFKKLLKEKLKKDKNIKKFIEKSILEKTKRKSKTESKEILEIKSKVTSKKESVNKKELKNKLLNEIITKKLEYQKNYLLCCFLGSATVNNKINATKYLLENGAQINLGFRQPEDKAFAKYLEEIFKLDNKIISTSQKFDFIEYLENEEYYQKSLFAKDPETALINQEKYFINRKNTTILDSFLSNFKDLLLNYSKDAKKDAINNTQDSESQKNRAQLIKNLVIKNLAILIFKRYINLMAENIYTELCNKIFDLCKKDKNFRTIILSELMSFNSANNKLCKKDFYRAIIKNLEKDLLEQEKVNNIKINFAKEEFRNNMLHEKTYAEKDCAIKFIY